VSGCFTHEAERSRQAQTAHAIDLPEGILAGILSELVSLEGRLDLALDRIAVALDPAPVGGR
jgi:hypothetical protein